jgi:hypothetical protein
LEVQAHRGSRGGRFGVGSTALTLIVSGKHDTWPKASVVVPQARVYCLVNL